MNDPQAIQYVSHELIASGDDVWINPIGGYGDIIMISSALGKAHRKHGKKFNLVYRTQYVPMLRQHPAIDKIGYPPEGSTIIGTDYWAREEFMDPNVKAIDVLTRIFGGDFFDHEDGLFLPVDDNDINPLLIDNIPWGKKTVVISPHSESIRKMMHPMKWNRIVEILNHHNYFVLQVGRENDILIKGAYSLLGVTSPKELLMVLKKADWVITLDNYIMHAAKLVSASCVCMFGPTLVSQYGYDSQVNLQADINFCPHKDSCLGVKFPGNYTSPCPMEQRHCMNQFSEQQIIDIVIS
jgi:ADP-heptose:LPS heptosyltransferase